VCASPTVNLSFEGDQVSETLFFVCTM